MRGDVGTWLVTRLTRTSTLALRRVAAHKLVLLQEWRDNGDTDLDVLRLELVSPLLVREGGALDRGVHRGTRRVMLQHAEDGRLPLRDGFQARLASAAWMAEAHVLERVRIGPFLQALRDRLAVTPQNARDSTETAAAELSRFDRGIPATVLVR